MSISRTSSPAAEVRSSSKPNNLTDHESSPPSFDLPVVVDPGRGGSYLQHDLEGENVVSILRYNGPGKVEGGKRYRVKVVVADVEDNRWNSAVFLENGTIRVVADPE